MGTCLMGWSNKSGYTYIYYWKVEEGMVMHPMGWSSKGGYTYIHILSGGRYGDASHGLEK